jgi:hypothetical protein
LSAKRDVSKEYIIKTRKFQMKFEILMAVIAFLVSIFILSFHL